MSGSPDGRSRSVSGQTSIQSQPGTSALACSGSPVTGSIRATEPVANGSHTSVIAPSWLIASGWADAAVAARNVPSVRTASSTSPCGRSPSRASVADLTAAAAWSTVIAATRDTPACRTARSRRSARRCEAATSHSRDSTSRYKMAEKTAITLSSRLSIWTERVNSTTGAISDASMSTASRAGETSTCCLVTGVVSSVIDGCRAAAPQAA